VSVHDSLMYPSAIHMLFCSDIHAVVASSSHSCKPRWCAGTHADVARNGGDLFEPTRLEIVCDYMGLDQYRRSVLNGLYEIKYLVEQKSWEGPEYTGNFTSEIEIMESINMQSNVTGKCVGEWVEEWYRNTNKRVI
jgi:hypothetical protein